MDLPVVLADADHPVTQATAQRLTGGAKTDREKLERLFLFVRDEIAFGFPANGDLVPASETIETRVGQCNTKAALLLALCDLRSQSSVDRQAHAEGQDGSDKAGFHNSRQDHPRRRDRP